MTFKTLLAAFLFSSLLTLAGCTTYGVIENQSYKTPPSHDNTYSLRWFHDRFSEHSTGTSITLAFSGGGTRAAALSYGVMQALRQTQVPAQEKQVSLLSETDIISAVSGGSFIAAYYGLYGDRLFTDFEQDFLRKNLQSSLVKGLLNPKEWFSSTGRTEMAVQLSPRSSDLHRR